MPGEEDSTNKPPASSPESSRKYSDENPFVAFRRFADEQISSMLQSVMGLPSSSTPPRSQRWAVFADEQGYRDAQRRQCQEYNDDGQSPDYGSSNQEPSQNNNTQLDISKSRRSGSENPFDIDMFFNSVFDWVDGQVSSRLFHPYSHPLFSNMTSADSPAWPVNYLTFSPYSPLHLERQARYRSHRDEGVFASLMSSMSFSSEYDPDEPRWREAFEDLLRLENGKPMLDRETGVAPKSEPGKEWLQALVKRGSLGDHWKFVSGSANRPWSSITLDRADRARNDGRPEMEKPDLTMETSTKQLTELDMYDRFLADVDAREREFFGDFHRSPLLRFILEDRRRGGSGVLPPEHEYNDDKETWLELVSGGNKRSVPETTEAPLPPAPAVEPPAEKSSHESYVVSSQTSTNRVHLPDGSIQTKIVKTKRFSDGREETNESTELVNPPQRDQSSDQQSPPSEQKKNGWFWKD